MKIRVTMKDPDTLQDAIRDAVKADVKKLDLAKPEQDAVAELREQEAAEVASTWFEYGEYLTVDIDTEAKTCVVVPVRDSRV